MSLILPFGDRTPAIDPTAWVAPNATVIGGVTLGDSAGVYYGAVLRADSDDITIGPWSNVQDNVTVHCDPGSPVVVGGGVSVGHGAVLHGCVIEDDCLIGMSATVLNGAVIGTGSLVAAGSVILENTVMPPGSLVAGVPASVRRRLSVEEIDGIRDNARRYAELSSKHRELS